MDASELLLQCASGERNFHKQANFSRANLDEAHLNEAANLEWVELTAANLTEADLHWASLNQANLSGAILHRAALIAVHFNSTILRKADRPSAKLSQSLQEQNINLNWVIQPDASVLLP